MLSQLFAPVKKASLLFLFLFLAFRVAAAQSGPPARDDAKQTISLKNFSVKIALTTFCKALGLDVEFDGAVKDDKFDLEAQGVTLKKAAQMLLQQKELRAGWSAEKKTVIVFPDTEEMRKRYEDLKPWPDTPDEKK